MSHKEAQSEWKARHSEGTKARATTWSKNKSRNNKARRSEGKKFCKSQY